MLIGDSHAAVAARSIIDVGTSFNLRTYVFTFQGCGFVLDPSELDPKYDYPYISTECIAHNKSILNFIETHNPDLVILGQRSSSIMVKPNNLESRISYKRVVAENLNLLREKSSKLILIGSAPELVSTPTWISKLFHTKSFFSEIPLEDNKFWGKWSVNGDFVDTTKIFCPRRICINRNSSGWLFYDTNHLSESGMKLLMPEIMKIIDRTIK